MSVTFHQNLAVEDRRGHLLECLECDSKELHPSYHKAQERYESFRAEHHSCDEARFVLSAPAWVEHTSVNLANSNAKMLLDVLGLPTTELYGEAAASTFVTSVEAALPAAPHGYVADTLRRLLEVGQEAFARDRKVVWS